jgi:hypothetical protein
MATGPRAPPTWGQPASSAPQIMEFQTATCIPGAPSAAPAMSLRDIPPHVAELSGRVPKLTHVRSNGTVRSHLSHSSGRSSAARRQPRLDPTAFVSCPRFSDESLDLIFWVPPTLQTGAATGFTANYGTPTILTGAWLANRGILNIATQYYQTISGTTTYVSNNGGLGGHYVDTGPYPAAGCSDPSPAMLKSKLRSQ